MLLQDLHQLNEALSSPYSYSVIEDKFHSFTAQFKTATDRTIEVAILRVGGPPMLPLKAWEIAFADLEDTTNGMVRHRFDTTGTGDEFRIFATVLQVLRDFITKRPKDADTIEFTSEKNEASRTQLYLKLVHRYTPPGWKSTVDSKTSDYRTFFTLTREDSTK